LAFAGLLDRADLHELVAKGILSPSEYVRLDIKRRERKLPRWENKEFLRWPDFAEYLNLRNDGNMSLSKFLELYTQTKDNESYEQLVSQCLRWEREVFDEVTGGDYWLAVRLMLDLYIP
jgi:hypothetical protein